MTLIYNWKLILKKAWSVRLIAAAAVLSGIEVILPFFSDVIPRGVFAALMFLVTVAALIARVVSQPKIYQP